MEERFRQKSWRLHNTINREPFSLPLPGCMRLAYTEGELRACNYGRGED